MGKRMGIAYLFDTNILIYTLNKEIPEKSSVQLKQIIDTSFNISAISKVEVLGWHHLKGKDLSIAQDFLEKANVIEISSLIIDKAIVLRQKARIKTPDAIIAATALCNDLTLITRNTKDFTSLQELVVFNPFLDLMGKNNLLPGS